jgi:hypothetical protein
VSLQRRTTATPLPQLWLPDNSTLNRAADGLLQKQMQEGV